MDVNKKGAELLSQSNTNCNPRSSRELQADFSAVLHKAQTQYIGVLWEGAEELLNGSEIAQEFEEVQQATYDALRAGTLDANGIGRLVGVSAVYWAAVGRVCIEGRM